MLEVIAQANGRELPPDFIINLKRRLRVDGCLLAERRKSGMEPTYNTCDLFSSPNLRRKTYYLMFIWLITTTCCVGMNLYSLELEGEVYINFLISAGSEVTAGLVIAVIADKCGRRCSFCVCGVLAGALACTMAINEFSSITKLTIFIVAKISISSSTAVLPTWSAELFPQVVRPQGLQMVILIGLVGPIGLPFLFYEGRRMQCLPLFVLGSLVLAGALVAFLLPETIHQKELYTLKDGELFGKYRTWRDCFRIGPPKLEAKNGILKNRGPQQQSPILSLLRRQDSIRRANSESEPEPTDAQSESSSDHGSLEETVKITVV